MKLHFMAHDLKPILLIDDKKEGHNRGEVFIQELPPSLQILVDFHVDVNQLIKKLDEWSVKLLFDPQKYVGVFLHHSYADPLLNPSQLSDLRDKLKNLGLIIFSGGTSLNVATNQIPRDTLYTYLKPAIDAYLKIKKFPTLYLFDRNINRFYPIIDEMYQVLEEDGKDALLNHKSFELFISTICGWDLHSVRKNYKERFTEEQIADKINQWRLNFNQ